MSIASHTSETASSLYTTTSSNTQWGPGAIAGKAILAMGKAIIRGVDYLVILRRISAIKSVIPCSDPGAADSAHSKKFETMFSDLLELSRRGLYPESIQIQAMDILVAQIARGHTHYLRLSLSKWEEHTEMVGFLSEIIAIALFPTGASLLKHS
ncbi:hypothetical protein DFH07DRAFT_808000 [Mycena maculata]|uniref:Uncharacterized protein n=1 Tax=Mycena maculata TaxID=230809 RepID=A0AAD7JM66_9AGAR|nr:hypothetical protein DFH07DRAFT_808000 [Mycena maculata]